MRRLFALAKLLPRLLCIAGHNWESVTLAGREHISVRRCTHCPAKRRKLGTTWMPCSDSWGWLPS
jgi:hypothetical protein